jgi:hypothetical protein
MGNERSVLSQDGNEALPEGPAKYHEEPVFGETDDHCHFHWYILAVHPRWSSLLPGRSRARRLGLYKNVHDSWNPQWHVDIPRFLAKSRTRFLCLKWICIDNLLRAHCMRAHRRRNIWLSSPRLAAAFRGRHPSLYLAEVVQSLLAQGNAEGLHHTRRLCHGEGTGSPETHHTREISDCATILLLLGYHAFSNRLAFRTLQ